MTINHKQPGDSGYVFFFNGTRIELYAPTLAKAGELARNYFRPSKAKKHMVHGMIAEREDGTQVTHSASL